jgi:AcrR family transcriptional regulator
LDLFGAQGFHDTSMEEIADEAGVTKPVVYQHFSSKRDLYLEVLRSVGEEMLRAIESSATSASTPHQQVLAGFDAYFSFVGANPSAFRILFGSGARLSEDFSEVVQEFEGQVAATIGGFIEAGVDREHRRLLGYAIVGLAEVSARRWVVESEPASKLDPAEGQLIAQRLAELVWAGLRGLPAE